MENNGMERVRNMTLKVKASAGFVARIEVICLKDDGSKETYKQGKDILVGKSGTVDLASTGFPVGSTVWLKANIRAGKDRTADEAFVYASDGGHATYETGGGTLTSWLKRID